MTRTVAFAIADDLLDEGIEARVTPTPNVYAVLGASISSVQLTALQGIATTHSVEMSVQSVTGGNVQVNYT